MGKLVVLVMFFVFVGLIFVQASESYDVDFSDGATQAVFLREDDEIRFNLLGGEHIIIIEDVGVSSIKVDIGPYINNNSLMYPGLIGMDYLMRLDLDKDGVTDVNVALYSVSAEGQVHLVVQDVTGEVSDSEETGVVEENSDGMSKTSILIIIGVIVLVLILFLVFRNGLWDTKEEQKNVHHGEHRYHGEQHKLHDEHGEEDHKAS